MGRKYLDSTLKFSNETYRVPDNIIMYHRYRQMVRKHLTLMFSSKCDGHGTIYSTLG
jgi:hypothetical protein